MIFLLLVFYSFQVVGAGRCAPSFARTFNKRTNVVPKRLGCPHIMPKRPVKLPRHDKFDRTGDSFFTFWRVADGAGVSDDFLCIGMRLTKVAYLSGHKGGFRAFPESSPVHKWQKWGAKLPFFDFYLLLLLRNAAKTSAHFGRVSHHI